MSSDGDSAARQKPRPPDVDGTECLVLLEGEASAEPLCCAKNIPIESDRGEGMISSNDSFDHEGGDIDGGKAGGDCLYGVRG